MEENNTKTIEQEDNPFDLIKIDACSAMTAKGTKCVRPLFKDGLCKQHFELQKKEDEVIEETKPWNSDDNPWSGEKLQVKHRRQGFKVRWTRPNKVGHRKSEGYTLCKPSDYRLTGVDGLIMKNELVLMELPDHLAQSRVDYMKGLTEKRTKGARKVELQQGLKNAVGLQE